MFKRLVRWLRRRPSSKPMATVYGWRTTGPRGKYDLVALRQVPISPVVRASEWPAPTPKRLKQFGPTEELSRANGQSKARKLLVDNLPDECTFL